MDESKKLALLNCYKHTDAFISLVSNQGNLTILSEIVETLSSHEHQILLENIFNLLTESVVDINTDYERVYTSSVILEIYVDKKINASLLPKCICLIHDNLLHFSNENSFVQNHCSKLLEKWWVQNLEQREILAVNVPSYLLARSLCPIGKPQDVSRLNNIKEMLSLIDLRCTTSSGLLSLLCLAVSNKLFLRNNDGVEFISYVILLDEELILLFHQTLKCVIPDLNDVQLGKVGEVYHKALNLSIEKGFCELFKKECIQNLIVCGLHCHRVGNLKAAPQVQKVLSVLHRYKLGEMEKILYELYQPLLWRALDTANGDVRANATILFLDVFPLIPSTLSKVVFQDTLEQQSSKMQDLLKDKSEDVRVCAVRGVSRVLDRYWEMLSAHHVKVLLMTLCCDMTHDMSSPQVIVAALQGIQLLLNNPLTHVALKKLLPSLQNHIYHPSPAVRNMFLSMLHTLHQTHNLKFWDIVLPEELLEVLSATKSGVLRKKLVELLLPLYCPVSESLPTQILAVFTMLKLQPDVHRYFYLEVYPLIGLSAALKLVISLLRTVIECMDKERVIIAEESKLEISVYDTDKIAQVLEICALLMSAAHTDLLSNSKAAESLCKKVTRFIPNILSTYGKDALCLEALSLIISKLPAEGLVPLKKSCYKLCKDRDNSADIVSAACLALVRVGGGNNILSYLSDIVTAKLTAIVQNNVVNPDSAHSTGPPQVDVSNKGDKRTLDVIEILLESEHWSEILSCTEVDTLYCVLLSSSDILLQYHVTPDTLDLRSDHVKYLVKTLTLAARFSIHLGGAEDMVHVGDCVYQIASTTRSGNSLRGQVFAEVLPVVVEGFLVLQFNTQLLQHLYNTWLLLGNTELLAHKLHLCKFLYKAGNLISQHGADAVDLCALLDRLLANIATSTLTTKELVEVRCLLVTVVMCKEQHDGITSKHKPWEGALSCITEHVRSNLPEDVEAETTLSKSDLSSLLQVLLDCTRQSETFARCLREGLAPSFSQGHVPSPSQGDNSKLQKFVDLLPCTIQM